MMEMKKEYFNVTMASQNVYSRTGHNPYPLGGWFRLWVMAVYEL